MAEPTAPEGAAAEGPHALGKSSATDSVAQSGAPDNPHSMQGIEKQRVQERIDRAGQKATIDARRTGPQAYRSTDKHALRMAPVHPNATARRGQWSLRSSVMVRIQPASCPYIFSARGRD